jgi:hypothetical protein
LDTETTIVIMNNKKAPKDDGNDSRYKQMSRSRAVQGSACGFFECWNVILALMLHT